MRSLYLSGMENHSIRMNILTVWDRQISLYPCLDTCRQSFLMKNCPIKYQGYTAVLC